MYSRFIESRRINYNRYTKITDTVDMSVPKALMREEDKRVFMLVDKNEMLPVGEVSDKSELVEVVLYDFNVKYVYNDISSDTIRLYSRQNDRYPYVIKIYRIKNCADKVFGGNKYNGYEGACYYNSLSWTEDRIAFLEGIGPAKRSGNFYPEDEKNSLGYLYLPEYNLSCATTSPDVRKLVAYDRTMLNRVYDGKGNVIYRCLDRDVAGIAGVLADGEIDIRVRDGKICVSADGGVSLTLWSMQGSKVAGAKGAGEVSVSTSGLVPGVYVVRAASADGRSATRKIVVK